MKNLLSVKVLSFVLVIMMLLSVLSVNVFAANSSDASIIKSVEITGVHTPYAGYRPDYGSRLGSTSYTYDDQKEDDPEVYNGKWWYDETEQKVVSPSDTFELGHIYTFAILLVPTEGCEFRVDNYNTPFISATVNGDEAVVYDDLTNKHQALIEYTFEPCDYNYEISTVEVNVEEPVAGGYPKFDVEILTGAVVKDESESPYCIESVAWYDCVNQTFLDPSHTFKEDGIYEVNVFLTTIGDYYFATDNNMTDVKAIINGKEGQADTAGKDDKYHIRVSCVVFGDIREEVSAVEVKDVTTPAEDANPDFTVSPVGDAFYINSVYWTDVTDPKNKSYMKETDTFVAGHTYELEVWIRANDGYKFRMDEDDFIDIVAYIEGRQAELVLPGADIAAIFSVTYTIPKSTIVSEVDIIDVSAPLEGEVPDMDAFCTTQGCNVSRVQWYDVTEGRGVLMNADDAFVAGRIYRVDVLVMAEGNHTFLMADGFNEAEGFINGIKAIAYGSHDERELELGLEFPACEANPNKPTDPVTTGVLGDANCDNEINIKDATAIQKHIAKLELLTDTGLILGDVDESADVNIKDATAIQKHIAGIDTGFYIGTEI